MEAADRKKKYTKTKVHGYTIIAIVLLGIVLYVGYIISENDFQRITYNELTASYISFNNSEQTDALRITNIKPMTTRKGESSSNKSTKEFTVSGNENYRYEIVLYSQGSLIDEKKVKFSLWEEKEKIISGEIQKFPETDDGGKIIYEGTVKGTKHFILKMWIDKSYEEDIKNVSYEVKIVPR